MSINLGTPAYEAIKELRNTEAWRVFCEGLAEVVKTKLHAALESQVENRVDCTGYARGLHDLHVALFAASHNLNVRQVGKLASSKMPATITPVTVDA